MSRHSPEPLSPFLPSAQSAKVRETSPPHRFVVFQQDEEHQEEREVSHLIHLTISWVWAESTYCLKWYYLAEPIHPHRVPFEMLSLIEL